MPYLSFLVLKKKKNLDWKIKYRTKGAKPKYPKPQGPPRSPKKPQKPTSISNTRHVRIWAPPEDKKKPKRNEQLQIPSPFSL